MLTLSDLFDYTEWADAALLDAAAAQGTDAWTHDLGGSFPTLQAVLEHIAGAEWVWLRRWAGDAPTSFPAWTGTTSPADLRDVFDAVARERRDWLGMLTESEITAPKSYTLLNGATGATPLSVQMQHVVNHSTFHRGQGVAMLRRLGAVPPPTDLVEWVRLGSPRR